jgi:hypothetical protein
LERAFQIFEEAKARGARRFILSHPDFILGASLKDVRSLAEWGVFIEQSICMWFGGEDDRLYNGDDLNAFIAAASVEKTIFGSDLGQLHNCTPVEGFFEMTGLLLELGYDAESIRRMVSGNAYALVGEAGLARPST